MGFTKKEDKKEVKEVKRVIPIDQNNEQFLLGQALNDKVMLEQLLSEVKAETFLFMNHKTLFQCMEYLYNRKIEVTPDAIETVKKKFDRGLSVKLKYVGELKATFSNRITEENYKFHLSKLKDDAVKDVLMMKSLPDLGNMLIDPKVNVEEIIQEIMKLQSVVEDNYVDGDCQIQDASMVSDDYDKQVEQREQGAVFGTTGYDKLDDMLTDGFARKKMSIIAGRTGMGKSAFLVNIFLRLGRAGIPVAFFNFEMDSVSMMDRLISIMANIELTKLIKDRSRLTPQEKEREAEARKAIRNMPIYFYGASTNSLEGIKRDLRILRDKHGVRIVAYDLFDKIKFRYGGGRSTADVMNDALKQIQGFGKDLDIHQILVVQIGRSAEKRKNKRPKLSELKDAGGYEERSDNIFFLYRPSYYNGAEIENEVNVNTMEDIEVIIAKQRQGVANVKAVFEFFPATTTIAEATLTDGMPEGVTDDEETNSEGND